MTDIQKAMLGDKEAAKRLTDRGELLPCPFCGKSAIVFVDLGRYGCKCDDVDCPGYDIKAEYGERIIAMYDWNTRPQLLTKEQIEALERMEEE